MTQDISSNGGFKEKHSLAIVMPHSCITPRNYWKISNLRLMCFQKLHHSFEITTQQLLKLDNLNRTKPAYFPWCYEMVYDTARRSARSLLTSQVSCVTLRGRDYCSHGGPSTPQHPPLWPSQASRCWNHLIYVEFVLLNLTGTSCISLWLRNTKSVKTLP